MKEWFVIIPIGLLVLYISFNLWGKAEYPTAGYCLTQHNAGIVRLTNWSTLNYKEWDLLCTRVIRKGVPEFYISTWL